MQPTREILILLALAVLSRSSWPQAAQGPVGLLIGVGPDARIVRRDSPKPVPARIGEMLFAGDRLLAGKDQASYLYCPSRSMQTLDRQGEALFQSGEVKVQKGKIASQKQVAVCTLPRAVQLSAASQQQVGALVLREVPGLKLLAPVGSPVLETPPKFAWQALKDAESYEIQVANSEQVVLWKTRLPGTEIPYPPYAPPLIVPATYSWRVTAIAGGKPIAATESTFQLLATAERQSVRQQLADIAGAMEQDPSNPAARLARAAVLERAGLLSHAVAEYRALAADWKDAAWLELKLSELDRAIQAAQRSLSFEAGP